MTDRGSSELVLFVDDDPELRETTQSYLQEHGYRVMSAGDGHEALHLFRTSREPFALVICDATLPGLDGGELNLAMKSLNPGLRFLMVTGHSRKHIRDSISIGPDIPIVEKPWTGSELLSQIRKTLSSPQIR